VATTRVLSPSLAAGLSPDEAAGVLQSLMANVPGAIYRVALDDGLSLRLIGDEIERISGYPAEDFVDGVGRTLFEIVHPDDRTRVEHAITRAIETGTGYDVEFRNVRDDGSVGWVNAKGRVVHDPTGPRMIGVNARNLETLEVDRDGQLELLASLPEGSLRIAESGVASRADVEAARDAGAQAVLVGTSLMRSPELLGDLVGVPR